MDRQAVRLRKGGISGLCIPAAVREREIGLDIINRRCVCKVDPADKAKVEDALSEEILDGKVKLGDRVSMSAQDGKLVFTPLPREKEPSSAQPVYQNND